MNEDDRISLECAERELAARAFSRKGVGIWEGHLDIGLKRPIWIRVTFTDKFPYELPELYVECNSLPRLVPHVDRKGKICIANVGDLIDSERPRQLIRDVLARAASLLCDGLRGRFDSDIDSELLSYLEFDYSFYSICNSEVTFSTEIKLIEFKGFQPQRSASLLADDLESGKEWLNRMGYKFLNEGKAWLHILSRPIRPPDYGKKYRYRAFFRDIRNNSSPEEHGRFLKWLEVAGFPAFVLVKMPLSGKSGSALYAVILDEPSAKDLKRGGFRGNAPFERNLNLILPLPAKQSMIVRLDREYLVNRGGAIPELKDCRVVIAGCGSIGSYLAEKIASLGVGNIRLIDNDVLSNDNVHRHLLGIEYLRMEKAPAMKLILDRRFPHLTVEYMNDDVIEVLIDNPSFITEADLLCVALGNETLEMNINRLLKNELPRIHTWVEPFGIGGHVFATGLSDDDSCYGCLFERDETFGLRNMSSFSAPGQTFFRTFAGCSGLFTPYSVLHAERTALEAATLAVELLRGRQKKNVLLSWYGDPGAFLEAGFKQSERVQLFNPGQVTKNPIPRRDDCICQTWPHS